MVKVAKQALRRGIRSAERALCVGLTQDRRFALISLSPNVLASIDSEGREPARSVTPLVVGQQKGTEPEYDNSRLSSECATTAESLLLGHVSHLRVAAYTRVSKN